MTKTSVLSDKNIPLTDMLESGGRGVPPPPHPAPLVPQSLSSVGGGERRGITPDLLAELTM